jgi:hypothetical protein
MNTLRSTAQRSELLSHRSSVTASDSALNARAMLHAVYFTLLLVYALERSTEEHRQGPTDTTVTSLCLYVVRLGGSYCCSPCQQHHGVCHTASAVLL